MNIDHTTQIVLLDREVRCGDGEPTNMVPLDRCFEFDVDTLNHVNALTESGVHAISAAQQFCVACLVPAEFVTKDDGENRLVTH